MSTDTPSNRQDISQGQDVPDGREARRVTVSYGAFTCTLEGYENPRETVEAIALFFRDLPGKERLLGKLPPVGSAARHLGDAPGAEVMDAKSAQIHGGDRAKYVYETALRARTRETATAIPAPPQEPVSPAPLKTRTKQVEPADLDVARLMSKVASEMADTEGASRRGALARLRGAVAASNAQYGSSSTVSREKQHQAYRADLQEAVGPTRAASETSREGKARSASSDKPDTQSLQLKPAQRVDTPAHGAKQDGSPQDADLTQNTKSEFATFVAKIGAEASSELVEAAASFIDHISKGEGFSRRQVMTKVREIAGPNFAPEQALLAFGQLKRAGKIRECGPGLFKTSEHIRFRPGQTRAN